MRYCIPINPALYKQYATVSIDSTSINGISAALHLIMPEDAFSQDDEKTEYLGLWTQGEGRLIIASVIADWVASRYSDGDKCTSTLHSFNQEMQWQEMMKNGHPELLKANRWCMAYYGLCYFCQEGRTAVAATPGSAADFGLDGATFRTAQGNMNMSSRPVHSGTPPRRQTAREALQQRFKDSGNVARS